MDSALRKGHTDALEATAEAVRARIASDTELSGLLVDKLSLDRAQFVPRLTNKLYLDGNNEDWLRQGHEPEFSALPWVRQFNLGIHEDKLYASFRVRYASPRFYKPADGTLAKSDYFVLNTQRGQFGLFAGSPGNLMVVRLDSNQSVSTKTREYQIKGHWAVWEEGTQLEFSMPLVWLPNDRFSLALAHNDAASFEANIVYPLLRVKDELAIFARDQQRIHLLNHLGQELGEAGTITLPTSGRQHGLLIWLYQWVVGKRDYSSASPEAQKGRLRGSDIDSAQNGQAGHTWFKMGEQPVARVSLPVRNEQGQHLGIVAVERSANSLANLTGEVFSTLLTSSFLVSFIAVVALVAYATWLSFRIRKLSSAAANAVTESGKITEDFPVFRSTDELGELSRSYAQLLARLREYTNYLRTLSSKLSHELRTPLAIVRSSLDNLEHEDLSPQAEIYAERAREGTSRLSNILNAMSAASRVEQAIGAAEREHIPCDQLLASLKAAYEDVYKHVEFRLKIREESGPFWIDGSGELLVQALDKLVDNAADFCPNGGLIELGLYRQGDFVTFTVRNDGPPLPSHMHGQLFDSMVSVRDTPQKEAGHHLGLGLYIVRLITDFHGGEVQGYNVADNSGVIFEVKLPAAGRDRA